MNWFPISDDEYINLDLMVSISCIPFLFDGNFHGHRYFVVDQKGEEITIGYTDNTWYYEDVLKSFSESPKVTELILKSRSLLVNQYLLKMEERIPGGYIEEDKFVSNGRYTEDEE